MHYAVNRRIGIIAVAAIMLVLLGIYHQELKESYESVKVTIVQESSTDAEHAEAIVSDDENAQLTSAITSTTTTSSSTKAVSSVPSATATTKAVFAYEYSAQNPPPEPHDDYIASCLAVKDQAADLPEWLYHHYYHMGVGRFFIMDDGSQPPLEEITNITIPRDRVEFFYYPAEKRVKYMQYELYNECIRIVRRRIVEAEKAKAAEAAAASRQPVPRGESTTTKPTAASAPAAVSATNSVSASAAVHEAVESATASLVPTSTQGAVSASYTPPTWMAFFDADEFVDATGNLTLRQQLEDFEPIELIGGFGINWREHTSDGNIHRPPNVLGSYFSCTTDEPSKGGETSVNRHIKSIVRVSAFDRPFDPHSFVLRNNSFTVGEFGDLIGYDNENNRKQGLMVSFFRTRMSRERFALHHYATKSRDEFEAKMNRGSAMSNHKDWKWWENMENGTVHVPCTEMKRWALPVN